MIQYKRKAFTIVELVIVIAVIAILAAVLIPTFASVIENAEESNAMQEAKNAYIDYLASTDVTNPQPMVYQSENKFVALKDGQVGGIYSTKTEALAEIGLTEADGEYMFDTGNGLLGYYKPTSGISFASTSDTLTVCKNFTEPIVTFEAWIKIPTDNSKKGSLFSTIKATGNVNCQHYEINSGSVARFMQYKSGTQTANTYMGNPAINTGKWVHIAIVVDSTNSNIVYYKNGEKVRATDFSTTPGAAVVSDYAYKIGNNFDNNEDNRFRGEIHSIAVYSDMRTAQEISKDAISPGSDSLIARWDLSNVPSGPTTVTDLSGNGYNASRS